MFICASSLLVIIPLHELRDLCGVTFTGIEAKFSNFSKFWACVACAASMKAVPFLSFLNCLTLPMDPAKVFSITKGFRAIRSSLAESDIGAIIKNTGVFLICVWSFCIELISSVTDRARLFDLFVDLLELGGLFVMSIVFY